MKLRFGWAGLAIFLGVLAVSIPASAQPLSMDLVIVLDESGSVCQFRGPGGVSGIDLEVDGVRNAINNVIVPQVTGSHQVQIAIVSFSSNVIRRTGTNNSFATDNLKDVFSQHADIDAALTALRNNSICGLTNLGQATAVAKDILDKQSSKQRRVINLVTNGTPTIGPPWPDPICGQTRAAGHEIWGIAIGQANLSLMTSCTTGDPSNTSRVFQATTLNDFEAAERQKLACVVGVDPRCPNPPPPPPGPPGPPPPPPPGPPPPPPTPPPSVPALSNWSLIALGVLMALVGSLILLRKRGKIRDRT